MQRHHSSVRGGDRPGVRSLTTHIVAEQRPARRGEAALVSDGALRTAAMKVGHYVVPLVGVACYLTSARWKPLATMALGRFFRDVARYKARRRRFGNRYALAPMLLGREEPVALADAPPDAAGVTAAELAAADGADGAPLWLAIRGRVYDVTAGAAFYGPGKSYHAFVGVDASRAFALGCVEPECVSDDLAGLSAAELRELDRWTELYETHDKYTLVGALVADPVDAILDGDDRPEARATS